MGIFRRKTTVQRSKQKSWFRTPTVEGDYISLAAPLSEKAADLIWGRGFSIVSEDETAIETIKLIEKHNQLGELFYTLEQDLSQQGNVFAGIFLSEGLPTILLSDAELISQRGGAFISMDAAVTWHRIVIDNASFPVQVIWDKEWMRMNFINNAGKVISVQNALKKVPPEKWPVTEWNHNMGFVPVTHFKNKPGAFRMYSVPDHQYTGQLEQWFNKILYNFNDHEVDANLTKLYGNMDSKDRQQIIAEAKRQEISLEEYLHQMKVLIGTNFSGDKSGDAANGFMQLVQSQLPATEWWHAIQQVKAEFYEQSGYSYTRPDKNTMGNTATDVLFTSARDMQTTKSKANIRQVQINELLEKVRLVFNKYSRGVISSEMTIDIKGNVFNDSMGEVDKSEKKLAMGTTHRVREIMKMEGVTEQEAKEILAEAIKEQELFNPEPAEEETTSNVEKKTEDK